MTSFWSNKRVMVTGGGGFLGSAVVNRLEVEKPAHVFVPRSSDFDLRTRSGIEGAFAAGRPDVVIHLAAIVGGIGANRDNPGAFFYENSIMGIELMEHARRANVVKYVQIGTACSYPEFTPVPFLEDDLWNGYPTPVTAPYGLAKKMLLVQGQAYRAQYGMNVIHLIPVNLYGPGDNFDPDRSHVVPALIKKCVEARDAGAPEVVIWGSGTASRDLLYVDDAADGIVLAAERYDQGDPVNLGSGVEVTIQELALLIVSMTGFRGQITWDRTKPEGQPRRAVDTRRAEKAFGFQAQTNLADGLRRAIESYERIKGSTPYGMSAPG